MGVHSVSTLIICVTKGRLNHSMRWDILATLDRARVATILEWPLYPTWEGRGDMFTSLIIIILP